MWQISLVSLELLLHSLKFYSSLIVTHVKWQYLAVVIFVYMVAVKPIVKCTKRSNHFFSDAVLMKFMERIYIADEIWYPINMEIEWMYHTNQTILCVCFLFYNKNIWNTILERNTGWLYGMCYVGVVTFFVTLKV